MSAIIAHGTVLRGCVAEGLRLIFTPIGVEDDEDTQEGGCGLSRAFLLQVSVSALGLAGEEVEDHRPSLIEPVVMRHGCPAIEYHRKA